MAEKQAADLLAGAVRTALAELRSDGKGRTLREIILRSEAALDALEVAVTYYEGEALLAASDDGVTE